MRIGVAGVGRGGCALAEALAADDADRRGSYLRCVFAVDTDAADLAALERVDEKRRHLVGAVETDGRGTDGDGDLAARVAREERAELRAAVDAVPVGSVDATVVCAALGGGTGSGVAPAVAGLLAEVTSTPVFGVGVLPGVDERGGDGAARSGGGGSGDGRSGRSGGGGGSGGGEESRGDDGPGSPDRPLVANAAAGVDALAAATDELFPVDLDVWRASGAPYAAAWDAVDGAVAARLGDLLAAGEAADPTPERVLDASELTNTLGAGGVAVVGGAGSPVETDRREGVVGGLLDRVGGGPSPEVDAGEAVSVATNAARKAVAHRLTLPCDPASARRAAVVFRAPPAWLNRRGLERARALIQEETGVAELRWGDLPDPHADEFRVAVLLSGVSRSERLGALGDAADRDRAD